MNYKKLANIMNQFILPGMNQDRPPLQVEKISHDDKGLVLNMVNADPNGIDNKKSADKWHQ
jgi:hypothetical protein